MKRTRQDRKALLDRLEKKYIKKIQIYAFKRENEQLKKQLSAMRGVKASHLFRKDSLDFDLDMPL
jgi:lactate dehydrogenase-like 2-hydroxyacid dehydrogenase